MNKKSKLVEQIEKLERLLIELHRFQSPYGFSYDLDEEYWINGRKETYHFPNMKDPRLHRDDAVAVCGCIRDMKDYCIDELKSIGKENSKEIVTQYMKQNDNICICCDLANSEKHNGISPGAGWSKINPKFSEVGFSIDLEKGIKEISYGRNSITTKISGDVGVLFNLTIMDGFGKVIGDAVEIIENATNSWRSFCSNYFGSIEQNS